MRKTFKKVVALALSMTLAFSTQLIVKPTTTQAATTQAEVINDTTTAMSVKGENGKTYAFDHAYVAPGDILTVLEDGVAYDGTVTWTVKKVVSAEYKDSDGNYTNAVGYETVAEAEGSTLAITDDYLETIIYGEVNGVKLTIYCSKTPVMYINSETAYYDVTKEYSDATINLVGNETYSDENYWYNGAATIKLRGNSTASRPKRPFKLKLDSKADLLGLGIDDDGVSYKSKHWVLLANDIDHSLLRNKLLYDFSGDIGTEYHFESTNVTVIYNGQYEGVYQLCEHRRVDEGRINITDWTSIGEDAADAIGTAVAGELGWKKAVKKEFIAELETIMATNYDWIDSASVTYSGSKIPGEEVALADTIDCTDGFKANATPWQTLTGDFNITYKFHVNGYQSNEAYQTFGIEFKNDVEENGNYWTNICNGSSWWYRNWDGEITNTCTDTDLSVLKDADVTVNISRTGNTITMHADCVGADGATATMDASAVNTVGYPDVLKVHLFGDGSVLTNITYADNTQTYNFADYGIELPETTGGFLAEMDFYSIDSSTVATLETSYKQPLYFSAPEPGEDAQTDAQKTAIVNSFKNTSLYTYAKNYTQTFEYALHSDDFYFSNSNTKFTVTDVFKDFRSDSWKATYSSITYTDDENDGKHYSELFDMDSLVNNFIFCEYAMNWDSMKNSFFYYKDVDSLAKIGPQWDFDWAWGNTNMYNINTNYPTSWQTTIETFTTEQYYQTVQWNRMLIRDPYFVTLAYEKYQSIRDTVIEEMIKDGGLIDTYYEYLKEAGAANDARWSCTYSTEYSNATADGFEDSIKQIKTFLKTRVAWLDKQFASPETLINSLGYYKTDSSIDLTVKTGLKNTVFTATVTNSYAKTVKFQINGTTILSAPVTDGVATVTVKTADLRQDGLNTVVANEVRSTGSYIYNTSASKTGNYNVVKSDYEVFDVSNIVAVNNITTSKKSVSLVNGKSTTVTATVAPANATTKTLKWTSANTKIATVSNGVITAKAPGTTTITVAATDDSNVKTTIQVTVKCKTPSVSLVSKTNSVGLKWTAVAGASKYEVYRSTSKTGTYTKLGTTTKTTYTDAKATAGKTYYYKVKAIGKTSALTSSLSAAKSAVVPKKVTTLKKKSAKAKATKLAYSKVKSATGYEIYRSTKKSSGYKKVATVTKYTTNTYTDKTTKKGKTYYYKIRTYKTIGKIKLYSNYSKVLKVKVK
jgi:hypothetical protein